MISLETGGSYFRQRQLGVLSVLLELLHMQATAGPGHSRYRNVLY